MKPTLEDITSLTKWMKMEDENGNEVKIDLIKDGRIWAYTIAWEDEWFIVGALQKSFDEIVERRWLTLISTEREFTVSIIVKTWSQFQYETRKKFMETMLESMKLNIESTHQENSVSFTIE